MSAARCCRTMQPSSTTSPLTDVGTGGPGADNPTLGEGTCRYLLDHQHRRDPYDMLRELRETEPVHRSDAGTWIISDHQLVLDAIRDDRLSRGAAGYETAETLFEAGPAVDLFRGRLVNSDGPTHARRRKLVNRSFTPLAVERWRPFIEETVDSLIDAIEPMGTADLIPTFCYPVPERVICEMLGVPYADHELIEEWTQVLNNRSITGVDDEQQRRRAARALIAFGDYVSGIVEERRQEPDDGLVSQLIAASAEGSSLDQTELVAMIVEMIGGGHDTTANTIANGVATLLDRPKQHRQLVDHPELIENAVEEILRYRSPVQMSLNRLATEDVEYGGVIIPAGSIVVLALAGANRDPAFLSEPEEFDVTRDGADNRHLSFGFGAHHCLGASLARTEVRVALSRLFTRLPDLRLTCDPGELPYRQSALITAPAELPVSW